MLETRRHAIFRILAQLPPSIVTSDVKDMPILLWENAVHLLMAEDARDCFAEGLYVPPTHPGRGRFPISRRGDTYSREALKNIRAYMQAEGLEFGKSGRFEWYLPVPVSSERTVLRPGVIVKGVIRPPAQETGSSALTRTYLVAHSLSLHPLIRFNSLQVSNGIPRLRRPFLALHMG